jgi:hypothetical protein
MNDETEWIWKEAVEGNFKIDLLYTVILDKELLENKCKYLPHIRIYPITGQVSQAVTISENIHDKISCFKSF